MKRFTIYIAHPISGGDGDQLLNYWQDLMHVLEPDFNVISPMAGKGYLRTATNLATEQACAQHKYELRPVSTDHAIYGRDMWMAGQQADILLVDLSGAKRVSIGCVMELQRGHDCGKHTLVVMEPNNLHRHAFVLQAADIIFEDLPSALEYLALLAENNHVD